MHPVSQIPFYFPRILGVCNEDYEVIIEALDGDKTEQERNYFLNDLVESNFPFVDMLEKWITNDKNYFAFSQIIGVLSNDDIGRVWDILREQENSYDYLNLCFTCVADYIESVPTRLRIAQNLQNLITHDEVIFCIQNPSEETSLSGYIVIELNREDRQNYFNNIEDFSDFFDISKNALSWIVPEDKIKFCKDIWKGLAKSQRINFLIKIASRSPQNLLFFIIFLRTKELREFINTYNSSKLTKTLSNTSPSSCTENHNLLEALTKKNLLTFFINEVRYKLGDDFYCCLDQLKLAVDPRPRPLNPESNESFEISAGMEIRALPHFVISIGSRNPEIAEWFLEICRHMRDQQLTYLFWSLPTHTIETKLPDIVNELQGSALECCLKALPNHLCKTLLDTSHTSMVELIASTEGEYSLLQQESRTDNTLVERLQTIVQRLDQTLYHPQMLTYWNLAEHKSHALQNFKDKILKLKNEIKRYEQEVKAENTPVSNLPTLKDELPNFLTPAFFTALNLSGIKDLIRVGIRTKFDLDFIEVKESMSEQKRIANAKKYFNIKNLGLLWKYLNQKNFFSVEGLVEACLIEDASELRRLDKMVADMKKRMDASDEKPAAASM